MQQHLLDRLLITGIVALHLAQHAQTAGSGLLLAVGVAHRLLDTRDLLRRLLALLLDLPPGLLQFALGLPECLKLLLRLVELFVQPPGDDLKLLALRPGLLAAALELLAHGGQARLAGAHVAQAVHCVDDGALVRLKRLLRLARGLLCRLQRRLLGVQLALQLRDLRARAQRVRLVLADFALERLAPGAADVLLLAEVQDVLLHARNLRAQHGQLALARFLFARELQHAFMRGGDLLLERLGGFVGRIARRRQLTGTLLLLLDGLAQAREHGLRVRDALLGAVAAQHEGRALQHAQLVAQGQIMPGRLARLGQRLQLAFQLRDDVLHAGEVVAHVGQALFALLLARAVFDDACRFLEDAAAVLALLGEDLTDAALADDRVALLAHAGITEELDDIAQAARRLVDVVFALAAAVHAAGDHDLRKVHRQCVVLVVKDERNLAVAQTLALLGAVEDHVLHLAAAQRLGALLAEHPSHRVRQVRFAAAVGAHDARDALIKDDDRPVRERLEAVDFQSL